MRQKFITRADLQANPKRLYLFGDNVMRAGLGGQAKEMRGEPNAVGVATKKAPHRGHLAYFTDAEYAENCEQIRSDSVRCRSGQRVAAEEVIEEALPAAARHRRTARFEHASQQR